MAIPRNYVRLDGSFRPAPTAPRIGPAPRREAVRVSVVLRGADGELSAAVARLDQDPLEVRQHVKRAQFRERFGAHPKDVEKVRLFARNNGLRVLHVYAARRVVELSGSVAQLNAAFAVDLALFRAPHRVFRGRSGWIHVPSWLAESVEGILGLDTRVQARGHFTVGAGGLEGRPRDKPVSAFSPAEVAALYDFPATASGGKGQCIGLIQLGGGFRQSDLNHYFAVNGIRPVPRVQTVSVDGATNDPTGNPRSVDGKVALDIQVVSTVAPGARIVVYFAPNTTKGYVDAIKAAVHDRVNKPSIISTTWGRAEATWTGQARRCLNSAFKEAVSLGITILAAAGDDGSSDGMSNGDAHVGFPASSPYVVSCGGTTLSAGRGTVENEVVWNRGTDGATGGGVSRVFPVPNYQATINPRSTGPEPCTGRGVPDVAGNGDASMGYHVVVHGQSFVIGGTTAVASLYAGLTALIQEELGRPLAPLNPLLYSARAAGVFHDIVSGSNGAYEARPGWDACSGLGRPRGTALLEALRHKPPEASLLLRPAEDRHDAPDTPDIRLVLTLLARDEADVIAANIEYHLAQGADAIIVTDNRSTDGTTEIVESYEATGRVFLLREDGNDYRQSEWVTQMARMASTRLAADWVINADADEFWWPRWGNLKSILRTIPPQYSTVTARRRNFVPVEDGGDAPFFARMTLADPDSRTSLGAPLTPKVCHRARPDITVLPGNHHVLGGALVPSIELGLLTILHFPMRSYEQFEHKVLTGASAAARRTQSGTVGGNLGHLYELYLHGQLLDYYNASAVSPARTRRAVAAGMLEVDQRLLRFLESEGIPAGPDGLAMSVGLGRPRPVN